jgi:two-component SAPR family response regulator
MIASVIMKAIVVDDEPIALEIVRNNASRVPYLELKGEFTNAFKALEFLQNETIDLIFLDIKMPDISGVEFYNSPSRKPLLIFTTAYSDHAVTSFEMDAVDYLLKPFSLARFVRVHRHFSCKQDRQGGASPGDDWKDHGAGK